MFETLVSSRRPALDEPDVTQILTPIFHALSGGEGDAGSREPGTVDGPGLFDQPTETRGTLQVIPGRAGGGAHRARSYSSRAGFHSVSGQPAADATGRSAIPGAHRAPEEGRTGVEESGGHPTMSRTGGRHRTLRAVSH